MTQHVEKEVAAFRLKFPLIFKAVKTAVDLKENADITTVQTEHVSDEDLAEFFTRIAAASREEGRKDNIEHCAEPDCPACNKAAYEAGRASALKEVGELLDKHDPQKGRPTSNAYWGNTLRADLEALKRELPINENKE